MKIIRFWKPFLWLAVIISLSLIPGNKLPGVPLFPHFDKAAHTVMYFGLAVLLVRPLRFIVANPYVWSVVICLITGMLMEFLQEFMAVNRTGSWADILANSVGIMLGILFYHYSIRGFLWEDYI
jgi:VanZ family protein